MIGKAWHATISGLAVVAGLLLVWIMLSVIVSVLMRNAGLQPFAWLFASAEYGLLYMTMLGAPWLVREKGHVYVELATAMLPGKLRGIVSRGVAVASALVCAILAWKGADLVLTNIGRGDYDTRAHYYPRWMLTIVFPLSFGLMAIGFARLVFGSGVFGSAPSHGSEAGPEPGTGTGE